MTVRWTLSRKILLLALLNLVLLGGLLLGIARSQFDIAAESVLLGPVHDRLLAVGNAFSLQYESTTPDTRDALIASYSRRYGVDVFLSTPRGEWVAGPQVDLPVELLDQMRRIVPPPRRREDLPPRQADPPPKKGPPHKKGSPPDGDFAGEPPPREEPPPPADQPNSERPAGEPPAPQNDLPRESVFLVITHAPTRYWAGMRVPLRSREEAGQRPGVLLLRSSSLFSNGVFFEWRLWLGVALGVIILSVACWLPFIRGMTRSIAAMDRATIEIARGNFAAQTAHGRRDELGDLGQQINLMGRRLEGFVKNQKRFLGDIAHELSAPIARIQFALGILEQKANDPLQPHVAVLHEEVQEMSGLINELLQFSKAGLQPNATPLAAVDVASVVRKAAAREASSAASFEIAVPDGLTAMAVEPSLLRAVCNILRNAVRYAGACGPISVSAQRIQDEVSISVADSGPGLPEDQLEAVFAPFYRPEESRTRETGGAGLGLAIVQTCVEACGGTVTACNRIGGGLEITIHLSSK
jgi:two-component system sensor histidine kinase CpxA